MILDFKLWMFWLELIKEMNICREPIVDDLIKESNEIVAIIVSSIKTVKKNLNPKSAFQNRKSKNAG